MCIDFQVIMLYVDESGLRDVSDTCAFGLLTHSISRDVSPHIARYAPFAPLTFALDVSHYYNIASPLCTYFVTYKYT